jgi:hypothetical protein
VHESEKKEILPEPPWDQEIVPVGENPITVATHPVEVPKSIAGESQVTVVLVIA